MATFGEVKTRVQRKYKGSQSVSFLAQIENAINDAIEFYQHQPVWFTEATTTLTLDVNDPVLTNNTSFPTDFLYLRGSAPLSITQSNQSYPLCKITASQYDSMNSQGLGRPQYYRELSGLIDVYPYPDQAYSCDVRYIKKYSTLTDDSSTNDWLTYAPQLIEAHALADLFLSEGHDAAMADYWTRHEADQLNNLLLTSKMRVCTYRLEVE